MRRTGCIYQEVQRNTGRYHITGRDGAFWLTDIKYNEE